MNLLTVHLKVLLFATFAKSFSFVIRILKFGHGSTWPGHIALIIYPHIVLDLSRLIKKRIIVIAGTNGKTTTSKMITDVLAENGNSVIHNNSGANLLNGIVSIFLLSYKFNFNYIADYAVLEVDEATIPLVFQALGDENITAVFLNLFRDQLDRYGEVDKIARVWQESATKLSKNCTLILNADDPQIAFIGNNVTVKKLFFGLSNEKLYQKEKDHAVDSVYCLNCKNQLTYKGHYYSHLGDWFCRFCGVKKPKANITSYKEILSGIYNKYNTLAAVLTLQSLKISDTSIQNSLEKFTPAFGRQEEIAMDGVKVKIFLSKNPVSMNESIRTVRELEKDKKFPCALIALNDNIPDGTDVSWIWDVDFENLVENCEMIICSGIRADDLAVRMKYAALSRKKDYRKIIHVEASLEKSMKEAIKQTNPVKTLYVLPTYSAMLGLRKIISGKAIL